MTGIIMACASPRARLSVVAAPGSFSRTGDKAFTFPATVASAVNNSGAVSYAWTLVKTGGTGTPTFTGQGTASAILSVTGVFSGLTLTATLTCAVTDAAGKHATSNTVTYTYQNIN